MWVRSRDARTEGIAHVCVRLPAALVSSGVLRVGDVIVALKGLAEAAHALHVCGDGGGGGGRGGECDERGGQSNRTWPRGLLKVRCNVSRHEKRVVTESEASHQVIRWQVPEAPLDDEVDDADEI